jgi:hypothetical protein
MRLPFAVLPFWLIPSLPALSANITWIGGTADWSDGTGNNANWNPADEPDADDTAIFNTANAVNLATNNAILGLTMSAGIDLFTNEFDLDVNGLVQLAGSSTNLVVDGAGSLLSADSVTINNLANLQLDGGTLQINEESGDGLLTINAGGELLGHGILSMTDAVAANTTLIVNDGAITARRSPLIILGAPQAGTLFINATDTDTRIDLDGAAETGAVTVSRNQTLDLNIPLTDIFNGSMVMAQNSVLDVSSSWILGANATINIDNGAAATIPATPAGIATIAGNSFSQNSGTITVVDADGTLQFDAPFSMNGGTLTNNGLVVFNQTATIAAAANFDIVGDADLTVEANRTVTINQTNFNFDGSGAGGTTITINSGGRLNVNVTDYDSDSATNGFDGTITVNSATISVFSGDAEFVMDGTINMNKSAADVVEWEGEPLDIGNDAGSLDADLNIGGNGNTLFHNQVDFNSDADVDVAAGCGLILNLAADFNTVNGGNNAQFTGTGAIRFNSQANFNEAVTFNMTGGTIDFDGLDTVNGDTINVDAPVTVNAASMESFGKVNTAGVSTLDINNSVGLGVLTVNLDNPDAEWTLNAQGVMNLVNDNTEATLLAGNDINLNGTVNVTGDVRSTARVDIGAAATININTAGQPLRLGGGNAGPDANTISGGTVAGIGLLGADTGKSLQGFGTISADIDFDGTANLRATGGTLTISGDLVDVNILGTADNTGILNIVNAWETDGGAGGSIGAVVLAGGVLQGGLITNDNATGLQGNGRIGARVINTSRVTATNGGTLLVQTAGNDNDWDGATNTGALEALSGDLEMVDTTAPVPPVRSFGGTVRAINDNRVFANGFALDFTPGSKLELEDEAIYRASSSTDIGGTVTIAAGADATLQVANNFFLTFETGSTTTLGGDLTVINNNINIEAGATFSGNGALIIPSGSHFILDAGANANVLVVNHGAFRPAGFEFVGRTDFRDYQQTSTGAIFAEITGTNLNQFDRLVVNGTAQIAGELSIDIDGVFVPVAGQTFDIITATGGVSGHFNQLTMSGMPVGLTIQILYGATFVRAMVVGGTQYDVWIQSFASLTNPPDRLKTADPDKDGLTNLEEFALAGDPTKANGADKVFVKVAPVAGVPAYTVTLPVRYGGGILGVSPPRLVDPEGVYSCYVEASDNLTTYNLSPIQVIGADAAAIQSGLPPAGDGWTYLTFRTSSPFATDRREFIRLRITN